MPFKTTDEEIQKALFKVETKRIARELAPELDRLINAQLESRPKANAAEELRQFLWDNKVGILRVLQRIDYL